MTYGHLSTTTWNAGPSGVVGASKKKSNVGAIAGGVVGGLVGLVLVGSLAYYFIRKSGQSGRDEALDDNFFGVSAGVGESAGAQRPSAYGDPFAGTGAGAGAGVMAGAGGAQEPAVWPPSPQGQGAPYGGGEGGYGSAYGHGSVPASGYGPGYGGAGNAASAHDGGAGTAWGHNAATGPGWSHDGGASAGVGSNPTGASFPEGAVSGSPMTQLSPGDIAVGGLGVAALAQSQRQHTQSPDAHQSVLSHPSTVSSGSAYPDGATMNSASNPPLMPSTANQSGHGYGGPLPPRFGGWSGLPEVQDRER